MEARNLIVDPPLNILQRIQKLCSRRSYKKEISGMRIIK